jgi:hypothetical protein
MVKYFILANGNFSKDGSYYFYSQAITIMQ